MIQVNYNYKDYDFSSIKAEDIVFLSNWIERNNEDNISYYSVNPKDFLRRFLESYITEDEIFIKISKSDKVIGILKGRIEQDKNNELFIWFYMIDKDMRHEGIGTKLIREIIDHFKCTHSVNVVRAGVIENNLSAISFLNNLGFTTCRISKNFFEDKEDKHKNLIIMKC